MNIQSVKERKRIVEHFEDPPVAQALFGHVRWAWIWLILRLYAGWVWLEAGWEKLHNPAWTGAKAGTALNGFVNHALTETSGAHPNVEGWYAWFLQHVVLPHAAAKVHTWRRVSVDRSTYTALRKRVHELELKVRSVKLNQPDPIEVLANAGFEDSTDRLPGWIHAQGGGMTIGPDAAMQSEGQQSLKMASSGPVA